MQFGQSLSASPGAWLTSHPDLLSRSLSGARNLCLFSLFERNSFFFVCNFMDVLNNTLGPSHTTLHWCVQSLVDDIHRIQPLHAHPYWPHNHYSPAISYHMCHLLPRNTMEKSTTTNHTFGILIWWYLRRYCRPYSFCLNGFWSFQKSVLCFKQSLGNVCKVHTSDNFLNHLLEIPSLSIFELEKDDLCGQLLIFWHKPSS